MFPGSSPAELSCRDPTNSTGFPHSQCPGASWSSATSKNHRVGSKAAENADTHCTSLVLLRKKKAAKRAGVRSAGRASCSRVASVPSPPSHVLQLYWPSQASSSPHTSPNHAVVSIYCRKLAPLPFREAATTFPRGCVGSWPNKHCPAPLLPHTSSFQACFPRSVVGWCPS